MQDKRMSERMGWCKCNYHEFPPENCDLWTTDGIVIRKGRWFFDEPLTEQLRDSWAAFTRISGRCLQGHALDVLRGEPRFPTAAACGGIEQPAISKTMCNRVVQKDKVITPGERVM